MTQSSFPRLWEQGIPREGEDDCCVGSLPLIHRVMKHYSPTGRRNHGRPLKRLLDTWDRNGSSSGPTPWQIYDDDDDNQQPNLPLQDQHEGTKIQASKTKPMQLTIREYYKRTYKRWYNTQYKKRKLQNWRMILGHLTGRRKLINGRNGQQKIVWTVGTLEGIK